MKRTDLWCRLVLLLILGVFHFAMRGEASEAYVNFEGKQTRPICLSTDGTRLFAVNTADGRLSVFDVRDASQPFLIGEISVGLEPVSVQVRTADEVWVVNEVSDSISVVSLSKWVVIDTIQAKDEPMDVVFAGGKAFVSVGRRNEIWVFDALTRARLGVIPVFGMNPRSLAVSVDGTKIYAAMALSGNRTTQIPEALAPPQTSPMNATLPPPPRVGLIVEADDPAWKSVIQFKMPDNDVAVIDVPSATLSRYYTNVGTINLGLAVHPISGDLFVANTEARNLIHFEPVLKGHVVDNRVTKIEAVTGARTFFDLNPGIDYNLLPNDDAKRAALAQPTALAFNADGSVLYVAAFGTDRIGKLDAQGNILGRIEVATASASDPRTKRGPRGMAFNPAANRLYVLNRISNTISIIDTTADSVLKELPVGAYDPTPEAVRKGRGFLYDAKLSGNGTASCATCHIDSDMDLIAWDLGDPNGKLVSVTVTVTNVGFKFPINAHPMKGPMMTQTLRGLEGNEPFHWRADRTNILDFASTFETLLGGETLNEMDVTAFRDFVNSIRFAPNPNQNLDRTYPTSFAGGNPVQGLQDFKTFPAFPGLCVVCHSLPPGVGSNNQVRPPNEDQSFQSFKMPHLRNLYQKAGGNSAPGAESMTGFDFMHNGQELTLDSFFSREFFGQMPETVKKNLSAFLLCFDVGMAPAVGYARTVTAANVNSADIRDDWTLLEAQAAAGNIDLVIKGKLGKATRGFLFSPSANRYTPDRVGGESLERTELETRLEGTDAITIMGAPPGSGRRIAIDRDQDGILDGDAPRPGLEVSVSAAEVILRWDINNAGYVIESSAALPDGIWEEANQTVTATSANHELRTPLTGAARYFRLRAL